LEIKLEEVEFIVDPSVGEARPEVAVQRSAPCDSPAVLSVSDSVNDAERGANDRSFAAHRNSPPRPLSSTPTQSSKPPIPRRQFASLSDFVASEPNRVALTSAQTAASQPGTYSPLTIIGPTGSGKTHLLEGIWRHVRTGGALRSVVYLTAEQFTNQFIDAIRDHRTGTPSFRRKIRDVDMLLIDDVQFFAGKSS